MRRMSKKIAALMSLLLVLALSLSNFGMVEAKAEEKVTGKAEVPVLDESTVLGKAANFGAFVDGTYRIDGHIDGTIAVGCLQMGNSTNYNVGRGSNKASYVQSFKKGSDNPIQVGNSGSYDEILIIPNSIELVKEGNYGIAAKDINGQVVKFDFSANKVAQCSSEYINFAKEFEKISYVSDFWRNQADTTVLKDKKVECDPNKKMNFLTIGVNEIRNNESFEVKNLGNNSLLVVNVDTEGKTEVELSKELKVNNTGWDWNEYAPNVVWNFGDFSGKITIGKGNGGVIIAPKASVDTNNTWAGSIICHELHTQGEIHYVPFRFKADTTPDYFFISSVDGTCCPSTPVLGGKYTLYKYNEETKKYKKVSTKSASDDSLLIWEIKEDGQYYVKQTEKVGEGYNQTLVKAKFNASKDAFGNVTVTLDPGSEAKGYSSKNAVSTTEYNGKTINGYKLRNYQNIFSATAIDVGKMEADKEYEGDAMLEISVESTYAVYEISKKEIGSFSAEGKTPYAVATANADNEFAADLNLQKTGYYALIQTSAEGFEASEEVVYVAVYMTPLGQSISVEVTADTIDTVVGIIGEAKQFTKITAATKKSFEKLAELADYADITDGWALYIHENR